VHTAPHKRVPRGTQFTPPRGKEDLLFAARRRVATRLYIQSEARQDIAFHPALVSSAPAVRKVDCLRTARLVTAWRQTTGLVLTM
jgi:hypothetical protein